MEAQVNQPLNCPPGEPNPDSITALYPQGSRPEIRVPNLSALCSYGQSPLVMQGALRQALIHHFSDVENIMNSTLREQLRRSGVWSDGPNTGIYIESLHRWRPELTQSRPGLILKEGTWQWQRMGIGDKMGGDYRSGRQFFGGYWAGSHTIFALANEGAEAQILAIEANKSLQRFQEEIATQLELQRFVPVSIGEVAALKESTENYVVPVVFAYVVPDFWYTQMEAPRLKRIVWRTSETLRDY
jgi:hypothetical protein